jgi:hypothetical protein
LASRVLRRQHTHRATPEDGQEVPLMDEPIAGSAPDERRYRPGRGGYDPEAAALAARARYLFRQRVVLGMLIGTVTALILALVASSGFWWLHAALDAALAAYLAYLRRQVRIEEEVRARRAARMAGSRIRTDEIPPQDAQPRYDQAQHDPPRHEPRYDPPRREEPRHEESRDVREPEGEQRPFRPPVPPPRAHPTAVALDLDDEDPLFDELDPAFQPRYRRAAGE